MSTVPRVLSFPPLTPGERLTQTEFHRRYLQYPDHIKFELLNGVVHMASPVGQPHGRGTTIFAGVLLVYIARTPGTTASDNATVILGDKSELQPDHQLRLEPEYGGQSKVEDLYVEGAPELIIEVADSREDTAMNARFEDYKNAGVCEYIVVSLRSKEIRWNDLRRGRQIKPSRDGILRSKVFPGLWVDVQAVLNNNTARILEVILQGVESPAHAAFVAKLQRIHDRLARRKKA